MEALEMFDEGLLPSPNIVDIYRRSPSLMRLTDNVFVDTVKEF